MKTHTITIKQDDICEDTNEFFYSTISLESGTSQITVIQPQVMVIIDDSMEVECGECRMNIDRYMSASLCLDTWISILPLRRSYDCGL